MNFRVLAICEVSAYLLGFALTAISLALLGFGVWSIAYAFVVQQTLLSIFLLVTARQFWLPKFHLGVFWETIHFSAGIWLTRILNFSARNGDYLVIGLVSTTAVVGVYSRSFALMQVLVTTVVDALEKVSFPALSRVKHNPYLQGKLLRASWDVTSLVYIPVGLFASLYSAEIVYLALGKSWDACIPVFTIFSIFMLFRAGYKTAGSVIRSQGKAYLLCYCQAANVILVLSGAWIGFAWGLPGSAAGVSLALAINFFVMNIAAAGIISLPISSLFKSMALAIPFCCPPVLAKLSTDSILHAPTPERLIAGAITASLLAAIMLFVTGRYHVLLNFRNVLKSI